MTPDHKADRETCIQNLHEKTGRTLDQWGALVRKMKLVKHGEIMTLLETKHGLSRGYANMVAFATLKQTRAGASSVEHLVAAQYAGKKRTLRPIYDALVAGLAKLGDDVELAPKKSYVSVRRSRQFALIRPSNSARVDVGIQLEGVEPTARLEASGTFHAKVSHRVRVSRVEEVNAKLFGWLRKAYELA